MTRAATIIALALSDPLDPDDPANPIKQTPTPGLYESLSQEPLIRSSDVHDWIWGSESHHLSEKTRGPRHICTQPSLSSTNVRSHREALHQAERRHL